MRAPTPLILYSAEIEALLNYPYVLAIRLPVMVQGFPIGAQAREAIEHHARQKTYSLFMAAVSAAADPELVDGLLACAARHGFPSLLLDAEGAMRRHPAHETVRLTGSVSPECVVETLRQLRHRRSGPKPAARVA